MPDTINSRYDIEEPPLGRGGMGVIYKAFDRITNRHVAVKAMREHSDSGSMDMFTREWSILASISHPNIVDILDSGEWVTGSSRRPFFVMPLLPGTSLDRLLRDQSSRLTVKRVVDILTQACRGLQAAHERGLVHRDLKPSNIFVLEDDSVKVIDFGVVHLAGTKSVPGLKGTLPYMAPEQVRMESPTPSSDIFSLGVVAYEALSGRKPFARGSDAETAQAIVQYHPPAASEINPDVPELLARVVHKAMAKQALHRFTSCREFAECMQKAANGESLERFDVARIQPRIQRAQRAFAESDYQFAEEILDEVEAEGHIDAQIKTLRVQVREALRQKSIRHLIEGARTRMEEDEYPLALQKVQDALELDPANVEALGLKAEVEKRRSEKQSANWLLLARQHLETRSFAKAKEALREVLEINPLNQGALDLLAETERREVEYNRARERKERLYQSAVAAFEQGEISSALSSLESLLDLNRRSPNSVIPERDSVYQDFYNRVRSERDGFDRSYMEGKRLLSSGEFARALAICDDVLSKRPASPMFQALRLEIEEQERQQRSAFIAEVTRRIEAERNLDRRLDILKEAADRFPDEFQQALRLNRERRDLVGSIEAKARVYEERGQFAEAIAQLDILQSIYPEHPAVGFDLDRLALRREQQNRETAKGRFVEEIDRYLATGEYQRATEIAAQALSEFQNDAELLGLQQLAQQGQARQAEARDWLAKGQQLCSGRQFAEGLQALRRAGELDPRDPVIRAALLGALVERARAVLGEDWHAAEPLVQQALALDPAHPLAKSLAALISDYRRQEIVDQHAARARELQVQGDLSGAAAEVERGLALYPGEPRLLQLLNTIQTARAASADGSARARHMAQLQSFSISAPDFTLAQWESVLTDVRQIRTMYPGDAEVAALAESVERSHTGGPEPKSIGEGGGAAAPPAPSADLSSTGPPSATPRSAQPSPWTARFASLHHQAAAYLAMARRGIAGLAWPRAGNRLRLTPFATRAAVAALVLVAAAGLYLTLPSKPVPAGLHQVRLAVTTEPAGANLLLDGKPATFPIDLPAGKYLVEATMAGYKTRSQFVEIAPSSTKVLPFVLALEAEPQVILVDTQMRAGRVLLDGQQLGTLEDGKFSTEIATAGNYTLSIADHTGEVLAIRFSTQPGRVPELVAPIRTRETAAVLVAAFGSEYVIFTSSATAKAKLPERGSNAIPAEGLRITDFPAGAILEIADGNKSQRVLLDRTSGPTLDVRLMSDRSTGTLLVEATVQDATVFLNGEEQRRALENGRWMADLEPKEYAVRLEAEGYEGTPEQTLRIGKGQTRKLHFELRPRVVMPALAISGGTAGAEVLLDGKRVGFVSAAGAFHMEVSPEEHTIELRKEYHEPHALKRTFVAGQTVTISGRDAVLQAFGSLEFRVQPSGARIRFGREGQPQSSAVQPGQPVRLPAGQYAVEASAEKHQSRKGTFTVAAGRSTVVEWTLERLNAPLPPRVMLTPEFFSNPAAWSEEDGGWFAMNGRDYNWVNTNGPLRVDLQKAKGRFRTPRIEWVIDYRDNRNYIRFSLGNADLRRVVVVDGNGRNPVSVAHRMGRLPYYSLQITIEPKRIVHRDAAGKVISDYVGDGDFTTGKWGFKGRVVLKIQK
jgi:serine/threonine-protein kinase